MVCMWEVGLISYDAAPQFHQMDIAAYMKTMAPRKIKYARTMETVGGRLVCELFMRHLPVGRRRQPEFQAGM
jgi:hypothetical protein